MVGMYRAVSYTHLDVYKRQGIGALGAVIVGIVFFKEPASAGRIFFATLLLVGIVGRKATSH